MHIKELVLDNFKSFGRKTRIPFYEDFTTVSGPNGSGKSNIIDSILFALGLARTSGIRAEKLTDLIYNPGHQEGESFQGEREASVEVVLNNADGTLSRAQVVNAVGSDDVGDVDEISITRRVKETEENYYSYYYINGRSVNLSDIQDLLSQAGVTPEGYNVVMQGDVTEIINMTAGSRREIIDEIAGVAEFDQKKEAAFEELAVVEDHIEEAELRIEEKEARLDQLEDERETALEYQDLKEQKGEYESYRKAAELEDKREELAEVDAEVADLEETLSERQAELDERQGQVMRLEDDLEELNAEIERKGEDEQLEIKRETEEIKGDIARLEDRIESAEETAESAENERRQAFVKIDRKQERIDELEAEIRETKVTKSSVAAELQEKEAELDDVEGQIEELGTEFEEIKADLQDRKEALEAAKDEKNDLQREQDRLLDEARRRSNEQSEKEAEIEEAEAKIPEIRAEIDDLEDAASRVDDSLSVDELMGIEATARKAYYRTFNEILPADFQLSRREYNPPPNEINSIISFGNSLVYANCVSAIRATALDPTISYLHEPGERRYSLSLDIADLFKPLLADRVLFRVLNRRQLTADDFEEELGACLLSERGRKVYTKEFEETLERTIEHPELNRKVSYQHLLRLEAYKLKKDLLAGEQYEPFKRWW